MAEAETRDTFELPLREARENLENQQEHESYSDTVSEVDEGGQEHNKHSQEYEFYNDVHDRADADGGEREYVTNGQEQERYRDALEPVARNRPLREVEERYIREKEADNA